MARPELPERLKKVRERIAAAAARGGRDPSAVRLLAATKTRSPQTIRAALAAGVDLIGENTVQEARAKFGALPPVEKHFIGHLQTNKVKWTVRLFDCIQSVDSRRLAERIEREATKVQRRFPVLVEVNPAGQAGKFGVPPRETIPLVRALIGLEHVVVQGLMALVPYTQDPELVRPYFKSMRILYNEFTQLTGVEPLYLSLGMSHDFEVAVEEGANLVRLGTALFGPRRSS